MTRSPPFQRNSDALNVSLRRINDLNLHLCAHSPTETLIKGQVDDLKHRNHHTIKDSFNYFIKNDLDLSDFLKKISDTVQAAEVLIVIYEALSL